MISLKLLTEKILLDILCIDETKIDESFPDFQFQMENYQFPPFRRDRNSHGGGKIVFIRKGLIVKRLISLESPIIESICLELTLANRKWCICFIYRPPSFEKEISITEMTKYINQMNEKYENILIAGDLNIDLMNPNKTTENYFSDFIDTFDLRNIITQPTCYKSERGTLLDLILTNKPRSFQNTIVTETGLSDFHRLVSTMFKSTFEKLPPKELSYRSYKRFDKTNFCHDLDVRLSRCEIYNSPEPYKKLSEIMSDTLEHHAPLKKRKLRGNHKSFINKELSKLLMTKSRIKNKYLKWKSRENFLAYKNIKNKCNNMLKKCKKEHFNDISLNGKATSKTFWDGVKPFMTNKGKVANENIVIECERSETIKIKEEEEIFLKENEIVKNDKVLVELFNNHYINIVENAPGLTPENIGNSNNQLNDKLNVEKIIDFYKDHESIKSIKENVITAENFDFPLVTVTEVNTIIKSLNSKKSSGLDGIPIKIIKCTANIIDCHMANIMNMGIENQKYPEEAKKASIRPIYKKEDRNKVANYRPVSILSNISKVYERLIYKQIQSFFENIFSSVCN